MTRLCLVQFVRLTNTLLKDEEGARDNHLLACNIAEKSPILLVFTTDRLSNKYLLICLLTSPPHLKYVLMFHTQGVVGLTIATLLQSTREFSSGRILKMD